MGIIGAVRKDRNLSVHPWLELSKFVPWAEGPKGPEVDSKKECYQRVVGQVGRREELARKWRARRGAWLYPLRDKGLARVETLECSTGAVLWLSAPTALELGFCLHHTYGLPYLPGSALKGLARAAALRRYGGTDEDPAPEVEHLFGVGGDTGSAGLVDFLDGIPLVAGCIEPDIMTPHHPKYYQGDEDWPHDSEGPTPLPFLRIKPGAEFEVALVARRAEDSSAVGNAMDLLLEGLRDLGLGGKTTSGYGVFELGRKSAQAAPAGGTSEPIGERLVVTATGFRGGDYAVVLAEDNEGRSYKIDGLHLTRASIYRQDWPKLPERRARLIVRVHQGQVVKVEGEER